MKAFVYRWTDLYNGKIYIGSHNGKRKDYIGSGKLFRRAYEKRPESFTREILCYGSHDDMLELEGFILEEVNASNNPMYYNLTNDPLAPMKGRKHSKESIQKMRESAGHNKGKKQSNEWVEKRMKTKRKKVIQVDTGIVFDSINSCAEHFGVSRSLVQSQLKGRRKNNLNIKLV
jgi:hypothetical protein